MTQSAAPRRPRSQNTPTAVRYTERQAQAVALRRAGLTFDEIAVRLGIKKQSAHSLVVRLLTQVRAEIDEGAEALRALELVRLDALHARLWPLAMDADLSAVDRILRIAERRAKLLGLDAPDRYAHGGDPDAPPIVAAAALLDWRALLGPTPITIEQEHPSPPDAP